MARFREILWKINQSIFENRTIQNDSFILCKFRWCPEVTMLSLGMHPLGFNLPNSKYVGDSNGSSSG
jgi:hypothetical protein